MAVTMVIASGKSAPIRKRFSIAMAWEILSSIVQRGIQRGSRSTVLNTLGWMATLLVAGLIGSITAQAKDWIQIFFAGGLAVDFLAFLAAFWFFAIRNPDALRSERFSIEKMAIEHGIYGDSTTGIIDQSSSPLPLLPATPTQPDSEKGE